MFLKKIMMVFFFQLSSFFSLLHTLAFLTGLSSANVLLCAVALAESRTLVNVRRKKGHCRSSIILKTPRAVWTLNILALFAFLTFKSLPFPLNFLKQFVTPSH